MIVQRGGWSTRPRVAAQLPAGAEIAPVGEFRFEPASGHWWRAGQEVALRPKTPAVLAVLAGRAGEVVGKDELRDAVWPDGL